MNLDKHKVFVNSVKDLDDIKFFTKVDAYCLDCDTLSEENCERCAVREACNKRYSKVAVGGTFDKFHDGHKKLLSTAFELGNRIEIGVTSDAFGGLKGEIDSCEERMNNLKLFFKDKSNFIIVFYTFCPSFILVRRFSPFIENR